MNDLPFEDDPPITEPPLSGEPDHTQAEDDTEDWDNIEQPDKETSPVLVSQEDAEPGPDHPSDPALVPLQPEKQFSHFVALSIEEQAEKGKLLAKRLKEIEGLEEERKDINHQIKELDDEVTQLRNALISGTVEVMTEQTDLLRQPVGPESAAAQFADMAKAAETAQEAPAEVQAIENLNQMAADIQAGKPGTEPSEAFLNDIENHKAKSAAKRKSGKAK